MVCSLLQGIVCAFSALMAAKVNRKISVQFVTVGVYREKRKKIRKQDRQERDNDHALHGCAVKKSCLIVKVYV